MDPSASQFVACSSWVRHWEHEAFSQGRQSTLKICVVVLTVSDVMKCSTLSLKQLK